MIGPPPLGTDGSKVKFVLRGRVKKFCEALVSAPRWTVRQVHWLANLPYEDYGGLVHAVYKAVIEQSLAGFIPIDNKLRAEREFGKL